jgi:hypothetical protein
MVLRNVLSVVVDASFGALLDGDQDDLTALLRKVTLTLLAALGGNFALALGLYFAVMLALETEAAAMPALAAVAFANVVPAAAWYASYFYIRTTKQATNATTNVAAWGGVLWTAGIVLALPQVSPLLAVCCLLAGVLIVHTNHRGPQLACVVLLFFGGLWNFHQAVYPETGMAAVPHARNGPFYERVILAIVSVVAFGFISLGVLGMTVAAHSAVDASDRALRMSMTVAELLRRYDTDAVTDMLEEYGREPGADPRILASYTALVANLNEYRPHLPNWMVASEETQSSGGSSHRTLAETETTRVSSTASCTPRESVAVVSYGHQQRRIVNISYGLVEFGFAAPLAGQRADAGLTAFVDRVHEWATATHASLHGFVGDVLQVSWNATHSVAQPEHKAGKFMAALVLWNRSADAEKVTAAAAVFSGTAECRFSGSGRVQALTVATTWRPTLQRCLQFAAHNRAVLMDSGTQAAASMYIETRAVEVVPPNTDGVAAGAKPIELHEIVGEHEHDDDEWMYVLERSKESTDSARVTAALRAATTGDLLGALHALDEVGDAAVGAARLVQRLRGRIEAALVNNGAVVVPSLA